jgi:hypothetical protein
MLCRLIVQSRAKLDFVQNNRRLIFGLWELQKSANGFSNIEAKTRYWKSLDAQKAPSVNTTWRKN